MDSRPHTKLYPEEARVRLGLAIVRGREAAGHQWRPSFARAAGISVRSLVKIEKGEPVGAPVYEAIGRALPQWTEDTPRVILEGGPIPAADVQAAPTGPDHAHLIAESAVDAQMLEYLMLVKDTIAESSAPPELINDLINAEFRRWRRRVPDATTFIRTWARWVIELEKMGVHAQSDYPTQTG
ncbi:MAG: hypothetical protein ACJ72N_07100 [Labedaea sp.]